MMFGTIGQLLENRIGSIHYSLYKNKFYLEGKMYFIILLSGEA